MEPDQPIRAVGTDRMTLEFPPNDLTPEEAEREIAGELVEWLCVFHPSGRQVARFRGTSDNVSISEELAGRSGPHGLYGAPVLTDHVIVHNHPPGLDDERFPLSPTDLFFTITHNLRRFVVVAGHERYELGRPASGWPIDDSEVMGLFREILDVVVQSIDQRSAPRPSLAERNLRVFELMAERGLIDFERH